jgi:alpha-amylase
MLLALLLLALSAHAQPDEHPWWQGRVFYEVFVRSFYDSSGDGVGDLPGLIEKLDYLQDLGITGLWLMPVTESPSYHGYDVTDYRRINPDYGTQDDFLRLMQAAHARGMAVIIDLVINHTSTQHPWFIRAASDPQSPYSDYYVWADEDPGFRGPDRQQVWHPLGDRYYYALFWGGMPDLNYENPAVTAEMYDIARFWLEEMGVDGFRLDAAKHIIEDGAQQEHTPATLAWLRDFNDFVQSVKPGALIVGEVWSNSFAVARYVPDSIPLAFEFDLAAAIIDGVRRRSRDGIVTLQQRALELYPPGQYAAFLTNHDQNRVMTELRGAVGAAKVAASILLTSPGLPFIYYGEEIGMSGQKPDERIRTPMQWTDDPQTAGFTTGTPWQPLDSSYETANVARQDADPDSLLNHYRALIALRQAHPALQDGDLLMVESPRPVYSFVRHNDDETLLVVINLHTSAISDYALTLAAGPLRHDPHAEVLFGVGDVAPPQVNDSGGFAGYVPRPVLLPRSTLVVRLS